MPQYNFLFILLTAAGFTAGCRKNIDITTVRELGKIATERVQCSLAGRVIDQNGLPVEDALVRNGNGSHTRTNKEGLFFFSNRLMDQNGEKITVTEQGFFQADRMVFNRLGGHAFMEIQLIPKILTSTFNSSAGLSFETTDGVKLTIPANAVTYQNQSVFNGQVKVYLTWLDPGNLNTFKTMPGDLRAIDSSGNTKILKSYGMAGVELQSTTGQPLQIKNGQKAHLSMPLSGVFLEKAPPAIPLWHFDTPSGYWKEEGQAFLENNRYEADVSHFSFWNCDVPQDFVLIRGQMLDPQDNPLAFHFIKAETDGSFGNAGGFTDYQGYFAGFMPANENIKLSIFKNCDPTVLAFWEIGPFDTDKTIDDLIADIPEPDRLEIKGKLNDCTGQPLSAGFVAVTVTNPYHATYMGHCDANGKFSVLIYKCSGEVKFTVKGYHESAPMASQETYFSVSGNEYDTGDITVCSELSEYIALNYDGQSVVYSIEPRLRKEGDLFWSVTGNRFLAYSPGDTAASFIYFRFGSYNPDNNEAIVTELQFASDNFGTTTIYNCVYGIAPDCNCSPGTVSKLKFDNFTGGNQGNLVKGAFSGKIKDDQNNSIPFQVQFAVPD